MMQHTFGTLISKLLVCFMSFKLSDQHKIEDDFQIIRDHVFDSNQAFERHVVHTTRQCAALCGRSDVCQAASLVRDVSEPKSFFCDFYLESSLAELGSSIGDLTLLRDRDMNACDANPCRNGATCLDRMTTFSCACAQGYTGKLCDTVGDYCQILPENPCKNSGTCTSGVTSYECLCTAQCTGDSCDCCSDFPATGCTETVSVTSPTGDFSDVSLNVFVETGTGGHDWIVLMRRHDGSQDFVNKGWADYKTGFGDITSEFWLGNDNLYYLTNNGSDYAVRFDVRSYTGASAYAEYSTFRVGSESIGYRLSIDGYSGTAGDSMTIPASKDQRNQRFKTFDSADGNCAVSNKGGWWYNACFHAKFTGLYGPSVAFAQGLHWQTFQLLTTNLKYADMKIRPTN